MMLVVGGWATMRIDRMDPRGWTLDWIRSSNVYATILRQWDNTSFGNGCHKQIKLMVYNQDEHIGNPITRQRWDGHTFPDRAAHVRRLVKQNWFEWTGCCWANRAVACVSLKWVQDACGTETSLVLTALCTLAGRNACQQGTAQSVPRTTPIQAFGKGSSL